MKVESDQIELENHFIELHKAQLKSSGIPEIHWLSLFHKLKDEIFDAGNYFQVCMRVDEDGENLGYKAIYVNDQELDANEPSCVFLIDHAWTYHVNEARTTLSQMDSLLDRMCNLMNIQIDEEEPEDAKKQMKIEAVFENMWKYNQTYKLFTNQLTDEEREPLWYIMDEFGSSIRHNNDPSSVCVPFFYLPTKTMYSVLWLKRNLNERDELTRDFAYSIKDEKLRIAKLLPWQEDDDCLNDLCDTDPKIQIEPDTSYFNSGREDEFLPPEDKIRNQLNSANLSLNSINKIFKVFTDINMVKEFLTDAHFSFVDEMYDADIIFISKHFKNFKELHEKSPNSMINQYAYENVVTVKDLLAVVSRRVKESSKWLPITYNLSYELPKFCAYFKQRENENLDNHWILKPWNLARSIDMTITKNLNQIIRCQETGPKIACKYIENPVLFFREELSGGVKFDIRYIVLLRSIQPLVIYTYNVFWLRFANKVYSLENLDDYEKHFTVMNYRNPSELKQVNCDEFIPLFEQQNPNFKWDGVQQKIFKMIRQVFEGASMEKPPKGICDNYQSRAMYAVDLMLDWREENNTKIIEPMICEINFMPDCKRACIYHPSFFNDIFNSLFLDKVENSNITKI